MEIKRLTEGDEEKLRSMTHEVIDFLHELMVREQGKPSINMAINLLVVTLVSISARSIPKSQRTKFVETIGTQMIMTMEANDEEST